MWLLLPPLALASWTESTLTLGDSPALPPIEGRDARAPYRVGLNMIRTNEKFSSADDVLADIAKVGGQGMRQLRQADLSWIQLVGTDGDPRSSQDYDFDASDAFLANDLGIYTIPTLFQIGPSSAASAFGASCPEEGSSESSWCRVPYTPGGEVLDVAEGSVEDEVQAYVATVARHLGKRGLRHVEILNEPERFKHYDLALFYMYQWGPKDLVALLEVSRAALRKVSNDALLVMPGLVYYDNVDDPDGRHEMWEDYFDKALSRGMGDLIDVVNFHYYGSWKGLQSHIGEVRALMEEHGIDEKPLWMTEAGSSESVHGEAEQAKDVVRFLAVAFGNGVELANWHTHISSNDGTSNWGGYGLRASGGARHRSWYTYRLFAQRLGNFATCTPEMEGKKHLWAFSFKGAHHTSLPGSDALVVWSDLEKGAELDLGAVVPKGWTRVRVVTMVPDEDGVFEVREGRPQPIVVTDVPLLVEKT